MAAPGSQATVNAGDMYGRSPLHLAVEHGHAAMAELLLERKVWGGGEGVLCFFEFGTVQDLNQKTLMQGSHTRLSYTTLAGALDVLKASEEPANLSRCGGFT